MGRKRSPQRLPAQTCPCGSGQPFEACCGPYLAGAAAPTATSLMRSRYTAYVRGDAAYLLRTWHPHTRPATLDLDPAVRWLGLKVLASEAGGPADGEGSVEFVVRYRVGGARAQRLHEVSRFVREGGLWVYLDGKGAGAD
jgi:SEC-C motif-containing protein